MKRTVYDCDKCERSNLVNPIRFKLDFGTDSYGEPDYKEIDICSFCAETLIWRLLKDKTTKERSDIYNTILNDKLKCTKKS